MQCEQRTHPSAEELESYALGKASVPAIAAIEEHVIVCDACQLALEQTDAFISTLREACAEPYLVALERVTPAVRAQDPPRRWFFGSWTPAWASLLCALVVVGLFTWVRPGAERVSPATYVALTATRGNSGPAIAPAGRPMNLRLDVSGLPGRSGYDVSVVDDSGHPIWTSGAPSGRDIVVVAIGKPLAAGHYWVRIADSRDVLREYELKVR